MSEWNIKGSRVYSNGEGKSYNCTNKITAQDLHQTLTTYETQIHEYKQFHTEYTQIEQKLDKINKELTQIRLTTAILSEELQRLQGLIQ